MSKNGIVIGMLVRVWVVAISAFTLAYLISKNGGILRDDDLYWALLLAVSSGVMLALIMLDLYLLSRIDY